MADINFDCPHCGQNLDAPEDIAGLQIDCPACNAAILIPGGDIEPPTDMVAEKSAPEGEDAASKKSTTMRLDLPPSLPPAPKRRIVKIKRKDK